MQFDHEKLDVYKLAVDFVAVAYALITALPPGHADLGNQLRRAATSIPLNIAEGSGEFSPGEKARFYRIARRSANECAAIIDVATRIDAVPTHAANEARAALIRIVSMMVKMIHGLRA